MKFRKEKDSCDQYVIKIQNGKFLNPKVGRIVDNLHDARKFKTVGAAKHSFNIFASYKNGNKVLIEELKHVILHIVLVSSVLTEETIELISLD